MGLIDKEILRNNLKNKIKENINKCTKIFGVMYVPLVTVLNAINETPETEAVYKKWIPVSEPPKEEGWYHVAIFDIKKGKYKVENDLYAIDIARRNNCKPGFCKERECPERYKLTHWMPLPLPPKGEIDGKENT